MKRKSSLLVVVVLFFISNSCSLATVSFQGLGYLPGSFPSSEATGVSGDASVEVGHSHNAGFWWTEDTGMVGYASTWGGTASYDGSVIASTRRDWHAFTWTSEEGMYLMANDMTIPDSYSIASDVSYDGSVVVGQTKSFGGFRAFRWIPGVGVQILGDIGARGFGVSPDGGTVVGQIDGGNREAFRWTESGGIVGLGTLNGSIESAAYGITEDGLTIVGRCFSGRDEAFLWNESVGMIGLGDLPGGSFSSWAKDVSADGSLIVGCSKTDIGWEAFLWNESNGMRNLKEVLEDDFKLNLTGWTLTWANGVSADGTTIVGRGYNLAGYREAWIATIPEPATVLLLGLGGLFLRKRNDRRLP